MCHFLTRAGKPTARGTCSLIIPVKRCLIRHRLAMTSAYATSPAMHQSWSVVIPGEPGSGCSLRPFFDIFANISVPNRNKYTKPRRPDNLRHPPWHKSEPASWAVYMFINIENKPAYRSSPSLYYIKEWHLHTTLWTAADFNDQALLSILEILYLWSNQ